jgi:hypothetical protein
MMAKKVKGKKPKIVKVLWADAHSQDVILESELPRLQTEKTLLMPYWSVGYLILETTEVIALAASWLPEDKKFGEDETNYRRVLFIPKTQIIERKEQTDHA